MPRRPLAWLLAASLVLELAVPLLGAPGAPGIPGAGAGGPVRGRLIETGWDSPTPHLLREHLDAVKDLPFDGVILDLTVDSAPGQKCSTQSAFAAAEWKREWFKPAVDDLRACQSAGLTENLVRLNANPGDVDWFDDSGWAQIVEHWRIAAWVAHEGGCRGILFDAEPYVRPHECFRYGAQPGRDRHTFAQYCQQARLRGRQVIEAVAAIQPDITIFCYFMNSMNESAAVAANPDAVLEPSMFGLFPAFINGWLDAAPPAMSFVDGCESSYLYDTRVQFLEAANGIRVHSLRLVAPKNQTKYRAQVRTSFGIYLDVYTNPVGTPWSIAGGPGNTTRLEHLAANVANALDIADAPVWVYGEKFSWLPPVAGAPVSKGWAEALSGCPEVLTQARARATDPAAFAHQQLATAQAKRPSLVVNGDFTGPAQANGNPDGWNTYREGPNTGQFGSEAGAPGPGPRKAGAAVAKGMKDGCFLQAIEVKPGQRFTVAARCRQVGAGSTGLRVRWQTAAPQKWLPENLDSINPWQRGNEQWGEVSTTVKVPDGAGYLLILLTVSGQEKNEDCAWFSDVRAYRLD